MIITCIIIIWMTTSECSVAGKPGGRAPMFLAVASGRPSIHPSTRRCCVWPSFRFLETTKDDHHRRCALPRPAAHPPSPIISHHHRSSIIAHHHNNIITYMYVVSHIIRYIPSPHTQNIHSADCLNIPTLSSTYPLHHIIIIYILV